MKKYYKDFILCGDGDFHCLLCNVTMHREDLDKHIQDKNHKDSKIHAVPLEEFKDHGIYQIEVFCYCMFCNCIVKRSKIKRHIRQERHNAKDNSTGKEIFKPYVDYVNGHPVVKVQWYSLTILKKMQWHGIFEHKCLICNVNVVHIGSHVSERDHIIRLIKTYLKLLNLKVKENYGGVVPYVYRHINEKLFQCFVCMKVLPHGDLSEHIATEDHEANTLEHDCYTVEIGQKLDSNYKKEIKDYGKIRAKLADFGREHQIKLNAGATKGFCVLCATFMTANMSVFKCHVKGYTHRSLLKLRLTKSTTIQPVYDHNAMINPFIKTFRTLTYLLDIEVFWINKEYIIPKTNFLMLREIDMDKNNKRCVCLACSVTFPCDKEFEHCMTLEHKESFFSRCIEFTAESNDHLFREVKPNIFHCSSCNKLFPYWETIRRLAFECSNQYDALYGKLSTYKGFINKIKPSRNPDIFYSDILKAAFGANIYVTTLKDFDNNFNSTN